MNVPNVPLQKAIETEKQLINLALYNKRTVSMLVEIDTEEFFIDHLKKIKHIIDEMVSSNKSVSPTSVYNEILDKELQNRFTEVAVQQYLGDADTIFSQFKKYHRIIKLQPVIAELWDMSQSGNINFDEKFDELSDMYSTSKVVQEAVLMADMMRTNLEEVKKSFIRFKSGIPSLDKKIKWLYGGQYITIAAAPGGGKTTMGINISLNIPDSLLMSYEMSAEEIHDIIVSRHTNIDSEKFEDGTIEFGEKQVIDAARRELADKLTLRICDKNLLLSDLMAFIKASVHKHKVKCVVIDYAQLIPGLKGKGTQTEKYEDLSRRLKLLARELKIIVIALSQLNKSSLSENRAPNLSDLRGSLSFGADADKVIFLYEIPTEDGVQCALGKNRKGKMGKVYEFYYNKSVHFMR
jgi:replicative DNA helicase